MVHENVFTDEFVDELVVAVDQALTAAGRPATVAQAWFPEMRSMTGGRPSEDWPARVTVQRPGLPTILITLMGVNAKSTSTTAAILLRAFQPADHAVVSVHGSANRVDYPGVLGRDVEVVRRVTAEAVAAVTGI